MLYRILATRHADQDVKLVQKLRLLYEAGYKIKRPENVKLFIEKMPNEDQEFYEYRCKRASYMPYFGQLVDYLVGGLFQNEVQVLPAGDAANPDTPGELPDQVFYPEFAADADRKRTPFSRIVRNAMTESLICRSAWVSIDMPPAKEAGSRLEEEKQGGARAYVCNVPYESVYDWSEDDDEDEFKWVILGKRINDRVNPEDDRDTYIDRFTVWRKDQDTGLVTFEIYETDPIKVGDEPKPELDLQPKTKGKTTFKKIPLERVELPEGLWAGNKVGPLSEEHFSRRSELVGSLARSNVEIPVVSLGPEVPEVGGAISLTAEDPNRGNDPVGQFRKKGYVVLDNQSKLSFEGPSGASFQITDAQLKDLRDEIFRSVHAMALSLANTPAAVGRSGDSKAEDRSATEIVLDYLGALARELGVRIYTTMSVARAEDVKWVAHGLDSFDLEDRAELTTEASGLEGVDIPSVTWKKEYKTRLALATVPSCSPETKAQIQREIAAGIQESMELDAARKAAEMAGGFPPEGGDPNDPAAPPPGAPKVPGGGLPKVPVTSSPPGAPGGPPPGPVSRATPPGAPGKVGALPPKGAPPGKPAPAAGGAKPAVPPRGAPAPAPADPGAAVPIHMRNATSSGIAETVFNQLAEDFPEEALQWVRAAVWEGPLDVPLDSIDFSGSDTWAASTDAPRDQPFDAETTKPIVLVNEPNQNKLIIVDGHHRALAARTQNVPSIRAFVAHVTTVTGPWDELHTLQRTPSGSQQ